MNLLIVDDEIFAIQGILDSVDWEKLNFDRILTANSYAQAINIFMEDKIDIMLSDIEMPYGSGIELVEWVRSHYPETECIFLTCHAEFNFAKQAITLKCLDYVLKPVRPEKLLEVLKNAITTVNDKRKDKEYKQYGELYVKSTFGPSETELDKIDETLEKVKNYVLDNISEPLTVESIARYVYLNPDYLTRVFKKKYGQTLIEYITEQRMFLAKELLMRNKMPINMIAERVGYSNCSYFTKVFKEYHGKTPSEFQREYIK